ncbi:MAG: SET domain-containing protein [Ginsengibacter sp.]
MALLEKYLVIKKSTIPGAGKGLYTKKMIPKGTLIVEYKGKISKWKDVDHKEGLNAYIYYVNRNRVIDASSNKNLARYANDAKGLKKIETLVNNCQYLQDDDLRVFIESKKDIPANSEILVAYGKEYWDVIKENKKEIKKKNKTVKKIYKHQ